MGRLNESPPVPNPMTVEPDGSFNFTRQNLDVIIALDKLNRSALAGMKPTCGELDALDHH
jgi:hypothetical protein